ncbi:MAG: hypothetical protein UV41_C0022G0017 [Candidatus Daviesbacteria bacterium GW2011_GWA2_42_7]|uniref:Uncharacterized protein n=1 Tax=Candidatus Daviesbacteria bacterium GW2011_GWA2_42_7 TaxID=1618425 RepID=A0A0G1BB27_9BACT|nr:MAG: hypothetical protein UV41_C0022G0017 [Candidatus Daviesbacteria bacterium GW2011_GWA2_42_7]
MRKILEVEVTWLVETDVWVDPAGKVEVPKVSDDTSNF